MKIIKEIWPYVLMVLGIVIFMVTDAYVPSALLFDFGVLAAGVRFARKIDARITFLLIMIGLAIIGGYLNPIRILPFEWMSSPFAFFSQSALDR